MRSFTRSLLAAALLLLLAVGCAPGTRYALIITDNTVPEQITDNPVLELTGEACATNILGVIMVGDASIATAAANGGITRVGAVNSRINSILGFYAKHCTVVNGT